MLLPHDHILGTFTGTQQLAVLDPAIELTKKAAVLPCEVRSEQAASGLHLVLERRGWQAQPPHQEAASGFARAFAPSVRHGEGLPCKADPVATRPGIQLFGQRARIESRVEGSVRRNDSVVEPHPPAEVDNRPREARDPQGPVPDDVAGKESGLQFVEGWPRVSTPFRPASHPDLAKKGFGNREPVNDACRGVAQDHIAAELGNRGLDEAQMPCSLIQNLRIDVGTSTQSLELMIPHHAAKLGGADSQTAEVTGLMNSHHHTPARWGSTIPGYPQVRCCPSVARFDQPAVGHDPSR